MPDNTSSGNDSTKTIMFSPETDKKKIVQAAFGHYLAYFAVLWAFILMGVYFRPEFQELELHHSIFLYLLVGVILAAYLVSVAIVTYKPLHKAIMDEEEPEILKNLFSMPGKVSISFIPLFPFIYVFKYMVDRDDFVYLTIQFAFAIGIIYPLLGYFLVSHFTGRLCEAAWYMPWFEKVRLNKYRSLALILVLFFSINFLGPLLLLGTMWAKSYFLDLTEEQLMSMLTNEVTLVSIKALIFSGLVVYFMVSYFSKPMNLLIDGMERIKNLDYSKRVPIIIDNELGYLTSHFNDMQEQLHEGEKVRTLFGRYVSSDVLEELLQHRSEVDTLGREVHVTMLFSDINGFTSTGEKLPPRTVIEMLNNYYGEMEEIIFRNRGSINQIIGDELMVVFGAPKELSDHAFLSVKTAVEMLERLDVLKEKLPPGTPNFYSTKIGIHTGNVIVGSIGTDNRAEFTAIGDTVNTASRLEQLTKILSHRIIMSEETYGEASKHPQAGTFKFIDLGVQDIRGREKQIRVYTVERA